MNTLQRTSKISYSKPTKLTPAQLDEAYQLFEKHRVMTFVELSKLKELLKEIAQKKSNWEAIEKLVKEFLSNLDKNYKQGKVQEFEFIHIFDQFAEVIDSEEWNCEKLDFLIQRMRDKSTGIEIKTRKWMFKSFELVFKGNEFVDWLLDKKLAKTRDESIYVGNLMLKEGRIIAIPSALSEFKVSDSFYRFKEDDKELEAKELEKKSSKTKKTSSSGKVPSLMIPPILRSKGTGDQEPVVSSTPTPRFIPFSRISSEVPTVPQQLITYLNENATEVPGVFRVSGSVEEVQNLKKLYDKAKFPLPDLTKFDIHVVAGMLKLWLRELPEPLLTFELYEPFIAATSVSEGEEERIECIRKVLKRLPIGNLVLLNFLVSFLVNVAAKHEINKMLPSNLAIVFTPTCLRPEVETIEIMFGQSTCANTLFETFIEKYAELFLPRDTAHKKIALKGEQAKYVFGTLKRAKAKLELVDRTEATATSDSTPCDDIEKMISQKSRHRRTPSNSSEARTGHKRSTSTGASAAGAWAEFFQAPSSPRGPPAPQSARESTTHQ